MKKAPDFNSSSQASQLDSEEQIARLSLLQWERMGPWALFWILQHFPSAEDFWREGSRSRKALAQWCMDQTSAGARQKSLGAIEERIDALQPRRWRAAELIRRWLGNHQHHLIWSHDDAFPEGLHRVHPDGLPGEAEPPRGKRPRAHRALFVEGDLSQLHAPCFAIVGGRACSDRAAEIAEHFAGHLAGMGLVIVSGMAEGIDAAAHIGALNAQGATIAVMGTGIDRCYPKIHHGMRARIVQQGAVISSLLPGQRIEKFRFLQRNALIAALSEAVLVVQARLKSGALSTAHAAADFGKTVFAVPGSIDDPRSKGCHQLIRQGACLTERLEDIYVELPWLMPVRRERRVPAKASEAAGCAARQLLEHAGEDARLPQLIEHFGHEPFDVHQLARHLQSGYEAALHQSLRWELQGLIRREPDGRYLLKLSFMR